MKYLEKLARIFQDAGTRVYAVGSFVRKIVCGDDANDVDLCGEKTPDELRELLKNSEFELFNEKPYYYRTHIGVKGKPNVYFDYTTFRRDYYSGEGKYHPSKITIAKNIKADYLRRDFTINAVYFDPLTKEYYDYCGGLIDMKHRLLKTIIDPDISFSNDATRILRMVKTAVDGPYNIEYNTFQAAKRQAKKIEALSDAHFYEYIEKIKNKTVAIKLLKEIFPWKQL